MGTTKSAITPKNVQSWLAATGFLFPTNEAELDRFEKMCADMVIPADQQLDPDVIMGKKEKTASTKENGIVIESIPSMFAMAARNGKGSIPQHILDKMKKKHQKPDDDSRGTTEEKAD